MTTDVWEVKFFPITLSANADPPATTVLGLKDVMDACLSCRTGGRGCNVPSNFGLLLQPTVTASIKTAGIMIENLRIDSPLTIQNKIDVQYLTINVPAFFSKMSTFLCFGSQVSKSRPGVSCVLWLCQPRDKCLAGKQPFLRGCLFGFAVRADSNDGHHLQSFQRAARNKDALRIGACIGRR